MAASKTNAYFAIAAIFGFAVIGLIAGSPNVFTVDSFGDVLRSFATDAKTRSIFGFIFADVVTGVIAALRIGTFDAQRIAKFYATNVVPYVVGYALLWSVAAFGLADVLPADIGNGVASLGYAAIMASLGASTIDNVRRASAGASPPDPDASSNRHEIDPATFRG
jgi:hypothetical protein